MTCLCSVAQAQLNLPVTWYANKRISVQYSTSTFPSSMADTVLLTCPMPIILNKTLMTFGLESFQVNAITWQTDSADIDGPAFYRIECRDSVFVLLWGNQINVSYKSRNNWWKVIHYDIP